MCAGITTEIIDNKCTITFTVDLIADNAMEFRKAYSKNKNLAQFVLDFKKINAIDSIGFGMMLDMRETIKDKNSISIVNANSELKNLMIELKLDQCFTIE